MKDRPFLQFSTLGLSPGSVEHYEGIILLNPARLLSRQPPTLDPIVITRWSRCGPIGEQKAHFHIISVLQALLQGMPLKLLIASAVGGSHRIHIAQIHSAVRLATRPSWKSQPERHLHLRAAPLDNRHRASYPNHHQQLLNSVISPNNRFLSIPFSGHPASVGRQQKQQLLTEGGSTSWQTVKGDITRCV